ncbi:phage tail tape measure protein [Bifidobacterium adolescentis]|uniref:Phage tail tape measure protein n=1 Tax=Bifidobacterium adolescentis TaxID=1680 RepID=A0AAX1TXY4_BIFAD|nr:phage tail tape measure protein [Bifidobacterium adolescentis]RHJ17230.1 phage tail tape measure protein [Bifidobacterium adolescentis]
MATNQNIVIRLMADTASYEASMTRAGSTARSVASGMENTGRKSALITSGLTAAGLAVTAFGVASVKMAADFDEQMSTVQANSGATAAQLSQLREAALQAGASTVYTAAESAGAINDLAKAGMSVSDILSGGLTASLNLAAAGQMDVGNAAEYMSQALTMFHLSGKDATSTADALAAGADKAVGDVSDFGEALNNCGVMANSFGMNLQETVGVLGLFAQNGIVGAEAGTQLNSMLMKLANPASDAKSTMEELGISTHDASGKFVAMANLAGQLHDKLGKLTDQQRQQAEATIFGSYAIKGAGIIMDAGKKGVEDWTKAVSDSGFAAQQASNKTNNLKGDLKMLESAIQSAMTKIGEGAQGPLRKLTQGLTDLITGFGDLPAGVQQAIVVMSALSGIMLGVHKAASSLNGSTSTMANNIGLAIDPIQRVKAALSSAQTAFEMFRASGLSAQEQLERFGTAEDSATLRSKGFHNVADGLISLMGGPWGIALGIATTALTGFMTATQNTKQAVQEVQSVASSGASAIHEALVNQLQNMDVGTFHGEPGWLSAIEQGITGSKKLTDVMSEAGISITTMTKAAEGNKSAIKQVNDAADKLGSSLGSGSHKATALRDGLTALTTAYQQGTKGAKDKSKALDELDGKASSAASSTKQAASATKDLGSSAEDASEEIDGLVKSLFGLESNNLTADEAVDQLNQKIGQLSDTCKDNGVVFNQNGDLLDRFSEKGTKTKQALEDIASSAQNAAEKILKQGENTNFSNGEIAKANGVLADAREAIIKQAEASGMGEQAANDLADRWGLSSTSIKASLEHIQETAEGKKAKLDVDDSKAKKKTKTAETNVDKFNKKIAKAKLEADDKKATDSAKKARKMMDDFGKKHVKATLDAKDNATKKTKTASSNVGKLNGKKATAKLDAKDNATPKVNKANSKKLTNKRNTLDSTDKATPKTNAANAKKLTNKRNTLDSADKAGPKVDAVNRKKLNDKKSTASVNDQATPVLQFINNFKIADKSFTVTEHTKKEGAYTGGMFTDGHFDRFAAGGIFDGYISPTWAAGNGMSDSVQLLNAALSSGEFVENAAATDYYGVATMRALNEMKIPREVFSTSRDMPIVVKVEMPADTGATTVNMPMKIVTTQQPSVTGTIIGRTASAAVRSAR